MDNNKCKNELAAGEIGMHNKISEPHYPTVFPAQEAAGYVALPWSVDFCWNVSIISQLGFFAAVFSAFSVSTISNVDVTYWYYSTPSSRKKSQIYNVDTGISYESIENIVTLVIFAYTNMRRYIYNFILLYTRRRRTTDVAWNFLPSIYTSSRLCLIFRRKFDERYVDQLITTSASSFPSIVCHDLTSFSLSPSISSTWIN